jgi:predicted component of viral defense system (DUF524 family)
MDEIVNLLMGEISLEIKTHDEPIFGSGKLIGASNQKDVDLDVEGEGGVSKRMYESVLRDLDIEKAEKIKLSKQMKEEKDKVMKELQIEFNRKSMAEKKKLMEELENTRKELEEIKLTAGGRSNTDRDAGAAQGSMDSEREEKAAAAEKKRKAEEERKKKDEEANNEMAAMMAMLGRN